MSLNALLCIKEYTSLLFHRLLLFLRYDHPDPEGSGRVSEQGSAQLACKTLSLNRHYNN